MKIKYFIGLALVALGVFALAGCNQNNDSSSTAETTTTAAISTIATSTTASNKDKTETYDEPVEMWCNFRSATICKDAERTQTSGKALKMGEKVTVIGENT